tara:strand:- start:86 stop:1102 length:1017 start_codon:yes stop_codon:yes gene_type:complete
MTINPQGYLTHCCALPDYQVTHIDDIDNLTDTFNNHPSFVEFRETLPDVCGACESRKNNRLSRPLSSKWNRRIRFLEFTMSNACNATCSMCTSYFSSSWAALDNKYPISSLSESAFQKILDIVPHLEHLVIKGGEPFLDRRNIILLEKYLSESKGTVDIITNGSLVNEICYDKRVHLGFSIDGTHEVYKWIRSTDWDTVINNAKKFYDATGKGVSIGSCISLHNYFHVEEFYDFFIDAPYVSLINQDHFADRPRKCSIHCLPDDILMDQRDKNLKIIDKYKNNTKVNKNNYYTMSSIKPEKHPKYSKENAFKHIDFMNKLRGFDLLDHVPALRNWKDM